MTLHETCTFDSLLQLVASGIATHEAHREAIESCTNDISKLARSILKNERLFSTYNERVSILKNLLFFRDAITDYTRELNDEILTATQHIWRNIFLKMTQLRILQNRAFAILRISVHQYSAI